MDWNIFEVALEYFIQCGTPIEKLVLNSTNKGLFTSKLKTNIYHIKSEHQFDAYTKGQ